MSKVLASLTLIALLSMPSLKGQNLQWINVVETAGGLDIQLSSTNDLGELALAGDAYDSINIGGLSNPIWKVPPSPSGNTFLMTYDSLGNVKWFHWMEFIQSNQTITFGGLDLDETGNVHLSGSFVGTYDMDPGAGIDNISSTKRDRVVAKYDSTGTLVWAYQTLTDPSSTQTQGSPGSIIVSGSGQVYYLTTIFDAMDLDPTTGTVMVNPVPGLQSQILIKVGATGQYLGHILFDHPTNSDFVAPTAMGFNATETAVLIGGIYNGTVDFDPGPATQLETSVGGNTDMFFMKFTTSGLGYQWHKLLSGNGTGGIASIQSDLNDNIYLSGSVYNEIDLDPGTSTYTLISIGNTGFLARYGSTGGFFYAKQCDYYSPSIIVDEVPSIWMWENFSGTTDIEPGAGVTNLTSTGGNDMVVHRHNFNSGIMWYGQITGSGAENFETQTASKTQIFYGIGSTQSVDNDIDPTANTYNAPAINGVKTWFIFKLAPWLAPVGISESMDHLKVFPNPSSGHWNILSERSLEGGYQLLDLSGKIVGEGSLHNQFAFSIDNDNLKPGLYLLKIVTAWGQPALLKLLKE